MLFPLLRAVAAVVGAASVALVTTAPTTTASGMERQVQASRPLAGRLSPYYLSNVTAVDSRGWWESGTADINGITYQWSVLANPSGVGDRAEGAYSLQRACRSLRFTAGIQDFSDPASAAQFAVYGDAQQLARFDVASGQSVTQRLPVSGVRLLRLVVTATIDGVTVRAAYGDARLRCSRPL